MVRHALICGFHLRTCLRTAELGDGAVKKVDLVVKVDHCTIISVFSFHTSSTDDRRTIDSQPLIFILALGQLDHLSQTSTSERSFGELLKLPTIRALLRPLRLERASRPRVAVAIVGQKVSLHANLVKAKAQSTPILMRLTSGQFRRA